jgi:hypothetical protein
MGGKTSTTSSGVTIPPEVLARYNSVNATAQDVAQTPFQQYSTNPNAFVAPLTPTQQAGISNTNAAVGMAQPYYDAAGGFALAGAQPVNAAPLNTSAYMNPYLQTVLGSTEANVNQQNQQAMSGQTGTAMQQGYFGGDRAGIAAAVLQGQQQLTGGQLYSGIASDAYNQAIAAASQQQGVNLGAEQANRAAIQQTGETLAGLGTTAQGTAMAAAQAQLGAGQVQQQTTQAGDTALYNQFLQQQSYPFQTAQFLANIAEGTGALSGNTTTTTQPGGLFSDERLKEGMEPIGKGFDGANIYRFRYRGDPTTRIGMSAQEVERRHPEAVGEHGGFKTVDYGAATDDAARRGGFALAANDNDGEERRARQAGGMSGWGMYPPGVNPMSIGELLQAQQQMYGPGFEGAGLYGGSSSGAPHGGSSYVPAPMGGSPMMIHGTPAPARPPTTASDALHTAAGLSGDVTGLEDDAKDASSAYGWLKGHLGPVNASGWTDVGSDATGSTPGANANGGFVRAARQDGGGFDPSDPNNDDPYGAKGPGLNIPTAPEQHQQLQGTKPPGQQQSGVSQLLGAGADVAGIAKAAPEIGAMASGIGSGLAGLGSSLASFLPFLALASGGRIGRAEGGMLDSLRADLEGGDNDPIEDQLLRQALAPPKAGFAGADADAAPSAGPAGAPAGGGASAGFAGAKTPGAPAEGAGFAGAAPGGSLGHIFGLEGTGANPRSSAVGVGQLLDGTYMGLLRRAHPDIAAQVGSDPASIKAFRRTPQGLALSAELAPMNQADNRAIMQRQNIPVTPANEHVMWVLGAGDGPKVLNADPSTPLQGLISNAAIAANPSIMRGKTAGEFRTWAHHGMAAGGRAGFQDGGVLPDDDANPTPDEIAAAEAKKAGFDSAVVDQAHANRAAAAEGQPSTPAAAAAVDAPAPVPTGAPVPAPPTDYGQAAASGFGRAAAAAPSLLPPAAAPGAGLQGADQTRGVGAPAAPPTGQGAPGDPSINLGQDDQTRRLAYGYLADEVARQRGPQTPGIMGVLQRNWIPLLQGAAAWAGAPTSHPLVALAQGAGAFATGEQAQRQYQLGQAQKLAELGQTGENVAGGAFGEQSDRMRAISGLVGNAMAPGGSFDQWFKPLAQYKGSERQYLDLRPGHIPGATVGESEVAQARQQYALRTLGLLGASGDPSKLFSQIYGTPGVSNPTGGNQGGRTGPDGVNAGGGAGGYGGGAPGGVRSGVPAGGGAPAGMPPGGGGGASPDSGGLGVQQHQAVAPPPKAAPQMAPAKSIEEAADRGDFGSAGVDVPKPDTSNLDDSNNPDEMAQQAETARLRSDDPTMQTLRTNIAHIQNADPGWTQLKAKDGSMVPNPYVATLAATKSRDAAIAANAAQREKVVQRASAFAEASAPTLQNLQTFDKAYAQANFNLASPELANVIGYAGSIPGVRLLVPDNLKQYQTNFSEAEKARAGLQMQSANGASYRHAPAAYLHTTDSAMPGPDQPAGARYKFSHNLWESYYRDQAYNQFLAAHGSKIDDFQKFDPKWAKQNTPDMFSDQATEQMARDARANGQPTGFYKGMAPQEISQYTRHPATQQEMNDLPSGATYWFNGKGYTKK